MESLENKFKTIIEDGFSKILKPTGFKKKNYNFYRQLPELGHAINAQRSKWSTKESIQFTINIGLFIPKRWHLTWDFYNRKIPDFPTVGDCAISTRIGNLKKVQDIWYTLDNSSDLDDLISVMKENMIDFILPYLDNSLSEEKFLNWLETEEIAEPLQKLIILAEFQRTKSAKAEYTRLINDNTFLPLSLKKNIREVGAKYDLN